tara:strand:+ start:360 stop:599 length:240 start_codon:yes stop_codon:yes gene_type:complete
MKKRKNFRKKRPKERLAGLQVKVYDNNVEKALKQLKRKIKNSNLMLDLKNKAYYRKPSEIKREKKNLAVLRSKYQQAKN